MYNECKIKNINILSLINSNYVLTKIECSLRQNFYYEPVLDINPKISKNVPNKITVATSTLFYNHLSIKNDKSAKYNQPNVKFCLINSW